MFGTPPYDFSEATLHQPISVEELDAFLNAQGRPFSRHRRMRHLLWRMRTTLATAQNDVRNLKRQVERLSATRRERVGTPTTLSPVDALRYASPEELAKAVDRISSAQLTELMRLVAEWKQAREAMVRDITKVRTAATDLLNRPDLPAAVRTEFARLLAQTPQQVPDRDVPHVIQLATDIRAQLPAAPAQPQPTPPAAGVNPTDGQSAPSAGQPAPTVGQQLPSAAASQTSTPDSFPAPPGFTPPAPH